jgi:UDP-2,4-diacetamido-2,4,6-trideoxy-beta-L-altropyranose hydrolase
VKVALRTDASLTIGSGHVMRCLALADALRRRGADCLFLSRSHPGHLHQEVKARGYPVMDLGGAAAMSTAHATLDYPHWLGVDWEVDAADTKKAIERLPIEWLVVDHYGLDFQWEQALRHSCRKLMAIDDLANRDHHVDALLDQNLGKTAKDYEDRVPDASVLMIGPMFSLLRPNFKALRPKSLAQRGPRSPKRILVTMGGVDKDNATGRMLTALATCSSHLDLSVTVVMGPHAPWLAEVTEQANGLPFPARVLVNVNDMAQIMCESDLAIGAAGSTSWERCCLGLPTLQIILAENQRPIAQALDRAGAALELDIQTLDAGLNQVISQLALTPEKLHRMSEAAAGVTDGLGADRVAQLMVDGRHDSNLEGTQA